MVEYDPKVFETKWNEQWLTEKVYEPDLTGAKRPFYNLWMFPYPSAEGLHIGGARTFVGVDIFGRYKRMAGFDIFQPVGLDGFGIHSENYALKIGKHPLQHAADSEKNFYRQMRMLGNGYAWDEKLETYDPEYYRWTQWIFVKLWKRGLAYRKKQSVNWCPKDLTVLADEQVEGGKCERCGTVVIKKELEQWFFRITEYADRLLKNIDTLDWSEKIKIAQKNWIGRSEGAALNFFLRFKKNHADNERRGPDGERAALKVFTTRPDTLFGVTYLVLSPEHPWVRLALDEQHDVLENKAEVAAYVQIAQLKPETECLAEGREKTGVELKGVVAINPANQEEIPIWVADYVLGSYGTGAIMAVPAHDERDFEFAKKFNLPIRGVIRQAWIEFSDPNNLDRQHAKKNQDVATGAEPYTDIGDADTLMNSGSFDNLEIEDAKWKITDFVHGERKVQFRLRDWLISRQRYWGPPIPMVHCEACAQVNKGEQADMPGWYAVPESELPVKLPNIDDFRPTGTGLSPLAAVTSFYETTCPGCGGAARRETDVSDTFLDSAWYFLRYPSVRDMQTAWDPEITRRWLPVDSYIGGAEHAVLHLLYSRFITMVFHDAGLLDFEEPFSKFRAHGLITKDGAKMSKSKGNVVNPDEYFSKFGADVMRLHLAFMAPLEQGGDFQEGGILGVERFLKRAWIFFTNAPIDDKKADEASITGLLHSTIQKVGQSIDSLHLNTGVSSLMVLLNAMQELKSADDGSIPLSKSQCEIFIKLLAPYAPYTAEELWRTVFKNEKSVHGEAWPIFESALIKTARISLAMQVNGKTRDVVEVEANITEDEAKALALANDKVQRHLQGTPKKVIYIEKRLINIVL